MMLLLENRTKTRQNADEFRPCSLQLALLLSFKGKAEAKGRPVAKMEGLEFDIKVSGGKR